MPSPKPAVRFVFITLLLDVIGFGLLIPVGPRLVEELQGAAATPQSAAAPFGWLSATFATMMFLCAPILGALSDRFGRRPVLLISLLGSGIDYFAQALTPSLWFLFVTRALNGVSGSSMSVCNAYIADVTPPEKRAAAFGIIGAAFGLGFAIGPVLGGSMPGMATYLASHADHLPGFLAGPLSYLGAHATRAPFWAAGVLCMINWLYGCFVLPESLPSDRRRGFQIRKAHPIATFQHLRRYPVVIALGVSLFLVNLAQFGLHSTWALYTQEKFSWSPLQIGISLGLVGLGAIVVQGGLVRRIVPALGEPRSVLVGLGVGVLAYIGYGVATQGWMIYVMVLAFSIGGIAGPASQAIITKSVPVNEQGETQGALAGINSIAAIVGPLIGSSVFSYFISKDSPEYLPGAPMFASALIATGSLALAFRAVRGLPKSIAVHQVVKDESPG